MPASNWNSANRNGTPPALLVQFPGRLTGARIEPTETYVTSARVTVTDPVPPSLEALVEFAQPVGSKLQAARTDPPAAPRESTADRRQVEAVLDQLRSAADTLLADRRSRVQEFQVAAVELAVALATKLLHRDVAAGEFRIDGMIQDMAAQLGSDQPLTVRLHPADLTLLERRLNGEPLLAEDGDPRLVPDPTLARGEVRLESSDGVLVSNVTRQVQDLRAELLRSLGHARA